MKALPVGGEMLHAKRADIYEEKQTDGHDISSSGSPKLRPAPHDCHSKQRLLSAAALPTGILKRSSRKFTVRLWLILYKLSHRISQPVGMYSIKIYNYL
jgi:hypothetical protein